jgi:hypothetical protein
MVGEETSKPNEEVKRHPPPKPALVIRVLRALKRHYHRSRPKLGKSETEHTRNERVMALWTRRVGIFTFFLFVISAATADIFYRQLAVMRADQRPWIGAGNIGLPPDGPFSIQFINSGKSPALNVTISAFLWEPDKEEHPPQLPTSRCTSSCKFIGVEMLPNVPYTFVLGRGPDENGWIIARADYEDADGSSHQTLICMAHSSAMHDLRNCPIKGSNYAN